MGNSVTPPPSGKPEVPAGFLVDFITQQPVRATPEETEAVQVFAQRLVEDFGYPKEVITSRPQFRVRPRPSETRARGYRILEVKIPSPLTSDTESLAGTVSEVMTRKAELKREIASVVHALEPPAPALSRGRPGWSMR